MNFNFCYKITYESGESYNKKHTLTVQITKEEYKKIIQGILNQIPISQIEGIPGVIEKMTENVQFADRWCNRDGSFRKTSLKKPRKIMALEFFLPDSEYARIRKMKNPMEIIDRPEEHMTVYRNDGSYVTFSCECGKVTIHDSANKSSYSIMEAEHFLSRILG